MIEQTSWFHLQTLYSYIRKQSEKRQFSKYIEIGSTFVLITIFLSFAIMPTMSAISSLIGDIKSKEILSSSMSAKITNIMAAQDSFSQIQSDYSVLESCYPTLPNFYKSASIFLSISKNSSIQTGKINFQISSKEDTEESSSEKFGISTNSSGQYLALINAIDKISKNRRLINIRTIQINQSPKDAASLNNQLNLNISTDLYYLPKNNDKK